MESTYDTTQQGSISRHMYLIIARVTTIPSHFPFFLSLSLPVSGKKVKKTEKRGVEKQGSNILKIQEQERINGCGNEERMRRERKE